MKSSEKRAGAMIDFTPHETTVAVLVNTRRIYILEVLFSRVLSLLPGLGRPCACRQLVSRARTPCSIRRRYRCASGALMRALPRCAGGYLCHRRASRVGLPPDLKERHAVGLESRPSRFIDPKHFRPLLRAFGQSSGLDAVPVRIEFKVIERASNLLFL